MIPQGPSTIIRNSATIYIYLYCCCLWCFSFSILVRTGMGEFWYLAVLASILAYFGVFLPFLVLILLPGAGWNHWLNLLCLELLTANFSVINVICSVGFLILAARSELSNPEYKLVHLSSPEYKLVHLVTLSHSVWTPVCTGHWFTVHTQSRAPADR